MRARLDGSRVQAVVSENVKHPYAIAVDPDGNRLYWFDDATQRIEVVTFDGFDRTLLLKPSSPISTLTIQGTRTWKLDIYSMLMHMNETRF